jgi:hypothetical protein
MTGLAVNLLYVGIQARSLHRLDFTQKQKLPHLGPYMFLKTAEPGF